MGEARQAAREGQRQALYGHQPYLNSGWRSHAATTDRGVPMKPVFASLLLSASLFGAAAAYAADHATPDEAKALAVKAADYLKSVGPDKAFPEFNRSGGSWIDRDLYVIVSNTNHVVLADGGNPGLIGHDTSSLKDVDGVSIANQVAAIQDAGWVKYKWQNPTTRSVEPKAVYWINLGDYHVGVGAYVQ
jgi:hypothetical protein